MKAVLVICEGLHDAIFVQRSLGAVAGCKWFPGAIRELPSPFGSVPQRSLNGLIATRMARDVEGLTLRETVYPVLPHFESAVIDEGKGTLFVQVRAGGDSQADAVTDLLEDIDASLGAGPMDIAEYAVAFLFDADEDGLSKRVGAFRNAYQRHFGSFLTNADHARWLNAATCHVGVYVVHRSPEDPVGTLEDHLAPMAAAAWPDHYGSARDFIDHNRRDDDAASRNDADCLKAVITSAVQFEHPGASLSKAIARGGIPSAQFERCRLSRDLVRFLQAVPWCDDEGSSPVEAH